MRPEIGKAPYGEDVGRRRICGWSQSLKSGWSVGEGVKAGSEAHSPSRQFCADLDFAEFDADFVFGIDAGAHDGVDDGAEGVVGDGDACSLVGGGTSREGVIPASQNVGNSVGGERGV